MSQFITSLISVYLVIGVFISIIFVSDLIKQGEQISRKREVVLFLTMALFWIVGLIWALIPERKPCKCVVHNADDDLDTGEDY